MEQKAAKNKKEAKKGFLGNLSKRQKISVGTIVIVSIAGIFGGIFTIMILPKGGKVIFGLNTDDIDSIDPLTGYWDEWYAIYQVCENLFDYDHSSGKPKLINSLATGYEWNGNATELTCTLREGVKFHDGTPFNAMAVKWNFDRIYRLRELFPSIMDDPWYSWGYLFILPDGRGIVKETEVVSDYTVKFVLNDSFVPFLQLLTHVSTSIVSPASTPEDNFINFLNGTLIGTGPFMYDSYEPHVNIILTRNRNYWDKKAKLDGIELKFYSNSSLLLDDFLAKKFHFLDGLFVEYHLDGSMFEQFKINTEFTIQESMQPNIRYVGMNNNSINGTMRKAISYAINYSDYVEYVSAGRGIRARSPIPEGCLYSNTIDFDVPDYNITHARKILKDVGWPRTENLTVNGNVSAGNEWEMQAEHNPLEIYNLTYNGNNDLHNRSVTVLPGYLKQLGIKLNEVDKSNSPYTFEHLFIFGWVYDYSDPHNGIHSIFSLDNFMELNDSLISEWIDEGVKEINNTKREQIYYNIQQQLIEVDYPVVWGYSLKRYDMFVSNLIAPQLNPYKILLKNAYFVNS